MFSRLGVFSGCEGECREVLIAGDLEGVLGGTERTGCQVVSVGIISGEISTAFGRGPTSSAVARLPRRLCWAAVGSRGGPAHVFLFVSCDPTARQHGFAHNSLPFFWAIMAPSGTWRLNSHNCRFSFMQGTGLAGTQT